jgi:hypothetical protein
LDSINQTVPVCSGPSLAVLPPRTIIRQRKMHLITFIGRSLYIPCSDVQKSYKFRMHAKFARLQGSKCKSSSSRVSRTDFSSILLASSCCVYHNEGDEKVPLINQPSRHGASHLPDLLVASLPQMQGRPKDSDTRIVRVHQSRT